MPTPSTLGPLCKTGAAACAVGAFLVVASGIALASSATDEFPFKIAAGPEGSSYHLLAEECVAYLEKEGVVPGGVGIQIITDTSGSVGNLRRLAMDPAVKFALSQEDVAHRFYIGGNYFFPERQDQNRDFTCVARLYDEHFYLCVKPEVERLSEIRNLYVWEKTSGSFATYFSLAEVYHPEWQVLHEGDCEQLFRSGAIDGFVSVESPGQWLLSREDWGFKLFSVNRTSFSNAGHVYGTALLPAAVVPGDEPYETISVSCVLVARRRADNAIVGAIIDVLKPRKGDQYDAEDAARIRDAFPRSADLLLQSQQSIETEGEARVGSPMRPRFTDFVMPSHPVTVERSFGHWWHWDFSKATLLICCLVLLGYLWLYHTHPRLVRWRQTRKSGEAIQRSVSLVLASFVVTTICIIGIQYFEQRHFVNGSVVAPPEIMNMSFLEVVSWLSLFLVSGFENGVFPASQYARFLAILLYIGYLALFGYFLSQFVGHLTSELIFRRERKTMTNLENHVIVCNWNRRGSRIVEELPIYATDKARLKTDVSLVIVAQNPRSPLPAEGVFRGVRHLDLPPWDPASLQEAGLKTARSVIVLLPEQVEGDDGQDGVVLRTCLAIRAFERRTHCGKGPLIPIAAEANLSRTRDDLYAMGVNETVISRAVGMKMLAQTDTCPGITALFDEVLDTATDSNEVYELPMPPALVNEECDFVKVLQFFRRNLPLRDASSRDDTVLPIGVRLDMARRDGVAGGVAGGETCPDALKFRLPYAVILHPSKDDFERHGCKVFLETDQVIALADDDPEGEEWLVRAEEATS